MTAARTCAFCDHQGDLSGEHIWPDWLGRGGHIGTEQEGYEQRIWRSHGELVVAEPKGQRSKGGQVRHQGKPHQKKLRVACRDGCNGGWMSQLEQAVKPSLLPLVKDNDSNLDLHAQRTLASWATKTAMVMWFTSDGPNGFIKQQRRALREALLPPPGTQVWCGRYDGTEWRLTFHQYYRPVNKHDAGREGPQPVALLQTTTFVMNHLLFFVFSSSTGHDVSPGFDTTNGRRHLTRIWPQRRPLAFWPPAETLDDGQTLDLAQLLLREG